MLLGHPSNHNCHILVNQPSKHQDGIDCCHSFGVSNSQIEINVLVTKWLLSEIIKLFIAFKLTANGVLYRWVKSMIL